MQLKSIHFVTIAIILTCIAGCDGKRNRRTIVVLDEESWQQLLEGEWMVDFYAPWCPACKSLEPEWRKFSEWSDDLNINVASADVTANPGLTGRFMISGLPTIYHVKDGIFRLYSGPREHTALINFVEEQGWKSSEPVSRWLAPNTLQMSMLAWSFRVSMSLREIHNYLVEEVGLPYYISYLIFALCTVTLGTVLGLLIVFVIDQFCPSRYASATQDIKQTSVAKKKRTDKTNDSDLDDADDNSKESKEPTGEERVRRRGLKND